MLQRAKDLIRRGWAAFRFRRHWPWVLVALGLPLALKPVDSGCAAFLAWVGGLVLVLRALRWIWDRLLFRVSRRLWMILALMSVLPVVALALMLTSLSWLGLGAQVSRSTQQTLAAWEEALKTANGAKPYLGKWISKPADWTPLKHYTNAFKGHNNPQVDWKDPWQFKNFLITDGD